MRLRERARRNRTIGPRRHYADTFTLARVAYCQRCQCRKLVTCKARAARQRQRLHIGKRAGRPRRRRQHLDGRIVGAERSGQGGKRLRAETRPRGLLEMMLRQ